MKKTASLVLSILLVVALTATGIATSVFAAGATWTLSETYTDGPADLHNPNGANGATDEQMALISGLEYVKRDSGSGTYEYSKEYLKTAGITITFNGDFKFSFTSPAQYPVVLIYVKAGQIGYVFKDGDPYTGTDIEIPHDHGISHVTLYIGKNEQTTTTTTTGETSTEETTTAETTTAETTTAETTTAETTTAATTTAETTTTATTTTQTTTTETTTTQETTTTPTTTTETTTSATTTAETTLETFESTTPPAGAPIEPSEPILIETVEAIPQGAPILPKTAGFPLELLTGIGVAILGIGSAARIGLRRK